MILLVVAVSNIVVNTSIVAVALITVHCRSLPHPPLIPPLSHPAVHLHVYNVLPISSILLNHFHSHLNHHPILLVDP